MAQSSVPAAVKGFTTSIRTGRGRLLVHVDGLALRKLGASDTGDTALLHTLSRHMPRFHALALQLAAREMRHEVTIGEADVWWSADEGTELPPQQVKHGTDLIAAVSQT